LATGYSGRIFTYLPLDIHPYKYDLSRLIEFTRASNIPSNSRDAIYEYVLSFLQSDKKRMALVETYFSPENVSKLQDSPRFIYSGKEVYIYLKSGDNLATIKSRFRKANNYPFICGLMDLGEESQEIFEQQQIVDETLISLAVKTRAAIIGAYDAVGYLTWERDV
jgi:hypothetical protein